MDPMNPQTFPTDLQLLALATANGSNWGSGATYGDNAQSLCNIQLPAYMARAWTLTLGAMRGASSAGGATIPPDYQVNTDSTLFKVELEWGVGGASERCEIDYPWAGMVCTLFGANIVVRTAPAAKTVGQGPPNVQAFLSPGARGGNCEAMVPTFTRQVALDGITGELRTLVPRRARAYRISCFDEDAESLTLSVYQEMARGPTQLCCDRFSGSGTYIRNTFPGGSPPPWTPLLSGCNQLFLGGAGGTPLHITYAIDLG